MSDPIEFFFDFSSPYAYFATFRLEELSRAVGREVHWKPIMIGAAFKETGNQPLIHQPLKGDYVRHDWARQAGRMGVPWVLPDPFPIAALAPSRAFYWFDERGPEQAKTFAAAAFHAYFGEGKDISAPDALTGAIEAAGGEAGEVIAAIQQPALKEHLKQETMAAIGRGVCGSPFFIVDGEPFWGSDRLWMIKKWIRGDNW